MNYALILLRIPKTVADLVDLICLVSLIAFLYLRKNENSYSSLLSLSLSFDSLISDRTNRGLPRSNVLQDKTCSYRAKRGPLKVRDNRDLDD